MWQGAVGFLQETSRQCVCACCVFRDPSADTAHTHKSTAFEVPGQTSWPRTGGRPRKSNWRPNLSGALCFPLKPSLSKFMCVGRQCVSLTGEPCGQLSIQVFHVQYPSQLGQVPHMTRMQGLSTVQEATFTCKRLSVLVNELSSPFANIAHWTKPRSRVQLNSPQTVEPWLPKSVPHQRQASRPFQRSPGSFSVGLGIGNPCQLE